MSFPFDPDKVKQLIAGKEDCDDGFFATPEGRLFLWSGSLNEQAREVTLAEAQTFWALHHTRDPYLLPPRFPDRSTAELFTNFVFEAILQIGKRRNEAEHGEKWEALELLDRAVEEARGLNELLQHRIFNPDEGGQYGDEIQCAIQHLCWGTHKRLGSAASSLRAVIRSHAAR